MAGRRILLWGALVLAGLVFLYLVRGILLPFVVALILAAVLEPAIRVLKGRGLSRPVAVYLVLGTFLLALVGGGAVVGPTVVRQINGFTGKVQDLTQGVLGSPSPTDNFFLRWDPVEQAQAEAGTGGRVDALFARYSDTLAQVGLPTTRRAFMDQYVYKNRNRIAEFVRSAFNGFFGFVTSLFSQILFVLLVPLLTLMMLLDMENIRRATPRWIPPSIRNTVTTVSKEIGDVFFQYLRGIALVVGLFAVAQTTLMLVTGVPYAFLLGVVFAALYLIPYLGNVLSAITLVLVIGLSGVTGIGPIHVASPWTWAAIVCGLYLLIGFVFDHLLYPQMVGNSVGLNPVVSLFVILCGEALFGLPGMIIAFPLAGSVKVILDRLIGFTSVSSDVLSLPAIPLRHRRTA